VQVKQNYHYLSLQLHTHPICRQHVCTLVGQPLHWNCLFSNDSCHNGRSC